VWNPIVWTLSAQVKLAGARLLSLSQYGYLNNMFEDRRQPFFSRLYYLLCSDEVTRVISAKDDWESNEYPVYGVIYDSLLADGV
jgi:hypothetical protein